MTGSDSGTGNLQACFGITANTLTGIDVRNNIFPIPLLLQVLQVLLFVCSCQVVLLLQ